MMFSDPASHRKTATPHGSVPINRADFVVSMSIPGTGRDAIVSRSHDADSAGGQDRAAREEYRARVLAEVREDLSSRGVDLSASKQGEKQQVERDAEFEPQSVVTDMNSTTQSETDLDHAVDVVSNDVENNNNTDSAAVTNDQDSTEATETAESSWDDWDMDDNEFDDVFGEDDELADSDDIPEDLDDILSDDLDDIPDDL